MLRLVVSNLFSTLPEQKYKVRVLQQPARVTVFADDGHGEIELFNERISGPLGKFVRLYGLGTPGDVIYFDNLIIRAPKSEQETAMTKLSELSSRASM